MTQAHYGSHARWNTPCQAATQIDGRLPDYWHSDQDAVIINRPADWKTRGYSSIPFRSSGGGSCSLGVALLNLESGLGTAHGEQCAAECLPGGLVAERTVKLMIEWPGYRARLYPLDMADASTGRYMTRRQLGEQITRLWKDFANRNRHETPSSQQLHLTLSTNGVIYDQVRLVELFTDDGTLFRLVYGVVANYLHC
ncbi:unnamed protein product [Mycena citricolor]|uniref:Uncharacterized protein n=1 Tax=Mycena citricolor TaxID=2018698 RepID=A0AAD2HJF4_9AGAR|nr:unnamed protein product [Mycena citricolor]